MKTKEEILGTFGIRERTVNHVYSYLWKSVLEAMQLYSDQQNKELRESRPFQFSPTNSEREWQVKIVNDYIHPNQEDWQKMNAVCNSFIEIQRLTKEVEELKNKAMMSVAYNGEIEIQNTRLKELLRESVGWLHSGRIDPLHDDIPIPEDVQKLIYDIDNELNPKP